MVAHMKKEQIDEEWSNQVQPEEMCVSSMELHTEPVHVIMENDKPASAFVTMETNKIEKPKVEVQLKFVCTQCGKVFNTKQGLERHDISHTKVSRFMCNTCGHAARSQDRLDIHIGTMHPSEDRVKGPLPQFACNQCANVYPRKQALKRHYIIHTKRSDFMCDTCGHAAVSQAVLDSHVRAKHALETPLRQFKCNECDKAYSRGATLRRHKISHREQPPKAPLIPQFECNQCGKGYCTKQTLHRHHKISHTNNASHFMCNTCGKVYTTKDALKRHTISHTKVSPFMCNACDYAAISQSSLDIHFRTRHTLERPFKCPQCDMAFPNKSQWHSHTRTHSEDKGFRCAMCDFASHTKNQLVRHVKLLHTNQRTWTCTLCSKAFVDKATLKGHMASHSTERPFKCPLCHSSFKRNKTLREHSEKFHLKGQRPIGAND